MKLRELAEAIGAEVLSSAPGADVEIDRVYAGDRISDLLNESGPNVLLVSNLASDHFVRVAELLDVPGICVVGGQTLDERVRRAAESHGTTLLCSPVGLFETCGRLYRCLTGSERAAQ